jgi:hypothetical protein
VDEWADQRDPPQSAVGVTGDVDLPVDKVERGILRPALQELVEAEFRGPNVAEVRGPMADQDVEAVLVATLKKVLGAKLEVAPVGSGLDACPAVCRRALPKGSDLLRLELG